MLVELQLQGMASGFLLGQCPGSSEILGASNDQILGKSHGSSCVGSRCDGSNKSLQCGMVLPANLQGSLVKAISTLW